ncbi:MAG: hypothetical protein ACXVJF_02330 [Acidimicrobiia bacterium]
MGDDITALLARPPQVPVDIARFTSNPLFGEPGIYPDGPPMVPAAGPLHPDAAIEEVMLELVGTAGETVFEEWCAARTAVTRLPYGTPSAPGRVVGPDAAGRRVVNDRYRAEDPTLLLPSIVHDLLWSGPGAGHAEETVLHALGAYVHAQLLARAPSLADVGTELARRQSSLTITLLNSRRPGSGTVTLVAPDGPGTIPGDAPAMQTPDFWSVPLAPTAADGAPIPECTRRVLAHLAGEAEAATPATFDDGLGVWCSDALASVLAPAEQLAANRALGLLP